MDESQDESTSANVPRQRSPVFAKEEVKVLLDIINEFKEYILNKSTTSSATHAKEVAWVKIANKFNSHGFKNVRTIDALKCKWKNLVKDVKKHSKNLTDVNQAECDEFSSQVLSLMHDEDNYNNEIELPPDFEEVFKEIEQHNNEAIKKKEYWNGDACKDDASCVDDVMVMRNRSMNFSPEESRLLLKCVQAEKKYILSRDLSSKARRMKNAAWARITVEFNKTSPEKRSMKVLQGKFSNMKRESKRGGRKRFVKSNEEKHVKLIHENFSAERKIKNEPLFEPEDEEMNDKSDSDDNYHINVRRNVKVEGPDPLCTVLNSDSGLGSSMNIGTFNPFENNDVAKLKMELLKYKIENAKLKRTRIENALREDAQAIEVNAIERALRLRAARLEVAAAELKLPSSHPTLVYTTAEAAAESYLKQYQT
ncbi:uncharacterized protein LOC128673309 [Plodia interpunctella]|uniref:uncharacterized protein LOC128673309 n=1 Tax=Plodia interpunctella TaxID=58824 RepID=UPI0023679BB6|nr:uncharacterized protein LOC128673309 [Plodia interpunctella]